MIFRTMVASAGLLAATTLTAVPALAQTTQDNCKTVNAAGECLNDAMPTLGPGSQQNSPDVDNSINSNNVQDLDTSAGSPETENEGVDQPGGGILELGPGSQQNAPDVDNNGTTAK